MFYGLRNKISIYIARYKKEKKLNFEPLQFYVKFLPFWLTWCKLIANVANQNMIKRKKFHFCIKNDLFVTILTDK